MKVESKGFVLPLLFTTGHDKSFSLTRNLSDVSRLEFFDTLHKCYTPYIHTQNICPGCQRSSIHKKNLKNFSQTFSMAKNFLFKFGRNIHIKHALPLSNYHVLFMFHNKLQVKHITFLANKSKKLFSIIVVIVWIIIVVGAITSIIVVVTSIAIRIIWIWKCKGIINSMDSRGIRQFFILLI